MLSRAIVALTRKKDAPRAENIEVYGSHCGLGYHPAAVYAIADRLAQSEGAWKKFDRTSGWRPLAFPDWQRGLASRPSADRRTVEHAERKRAGLI